MLVEEALVTEEAFGEPLRIIEPVDADDQAAADPALAHALLHVAGGGAACAGDEILRVDSDRAGDRADRAPRSEEHTSELQSLMRISYAVFCLKKKKNNQPQQ